MDLETMQSSLEQGFLSRMLSCGSSVDRAREARVSMMRLIHSIWMDLMTSRSRRAEPKIVMKTATTLAVSWNWRNFRMESQMFRPQRTAFTMELKLSSIRMMAAAQRATQVPDIPMAKPTSAFLRAGASLVPSPVTATTFPLSFNPVTKQYLSSGLDRAKTIKLSASLSNSSALATVSTLISLFCSSAFSLDTGQSHFSVLQFLQTIPPTNLLKSGPSMAMELLPSLSRPISLAMALAVMRLSPVTMRTVIPAMWHFWMAQGTSCLGLSLTPITAIRMRCVFSTLYTPLLFFWMRSSSGFNFLKARQRVLRESVAILLMVSLIKSLLPAYRGWACAVSPFIQNWHDLSTISEAPLMKRQSSPLMVTTTDILLRVELKGNSILVGYFSRSCWQFTPILPKYFSRAIQVVEPFYYGCRRAELLTSEAILKNQTQSALGDRLSGMIVSVYVSTLTVFPCQISVRTILFMVNVPVLSEQMLLAPPMVSQAYNLLIKF